MGSTKIIFTKMFLHIHVNVQKHFWKNNSLVLSMLFLVVVVVVVVAAAAAAAVVVVVVVTIFNLLMLKVLNGNY